MIEMDKSNPYPDKIFQVLTLHDEILSTVHISVLEEAKDFIEDCMLSVEQKFLGEIPAAISIGVGNEWEHEDDSFEVILDKSGKKIYNKK